MTAAKKIFTIPIGITYSKSAIETIEQGVKNVLSLQVRLKNDINDIILLFFSLTLNIR